MLKDAKKFTFSNSWPNLCMNLVPGRYLIKTPYFLRKRFTMLRGKSGHFSRMVGIASRKLLGKQQRRRMWLRSAMTVMSFPHLTPTLNLPPLRLEITLGLSKQTRYETSWTVCLHVHGNLLHRLQLRETRYHHHYLGPSPRQSLIR